MDAETPLPVRSKEPVPPINTAQLPVPQPNPLPIPPHNDNNNKKKQKKKRKRIRDVDIHNSAYFKILALVQQLRPHFVEVLQTPDFRNCKPAYEFRKRMKLVMDFYKQVQVEGNPIGNFESKSACQILSGEKKLKNEHLDGLHQRGPGHLRPDVVLKNLPEKELPPDPLSSGKKFNNGLLQGSYIVGGSVSGWNFITFAHRNPPVYYGVTKESHRHGHNRPEKGYFVLRNS